MVVSTKIMAGLIALRRFSVSELSEFTGINRNTVASRVRRNPVYFRQIPNDEVPSAKGRPTKLLELTAAASDELTRMFSNVATSRIESELTHLPERPPLEGEIESLRPLMAAFKSADSDARPELELWLSESIERIEQQIYSRQRAGDMLPDAELACVAQFREEFQRTRREGSIEEPDVLFVRTLDECLLQVDANSASHWYFIGAGDSSAQTLGLLAAVGLSDFLAVPKSVVRNIERAADSIHPDLYIDCFSDCFNSGPGLSQSLLPPIFNGIRRLAQLRESERLCVWMDNQAAEWSGPAIAAYARTRMAMPHSNVDNIVKLVEAATPWHVSEEPELSVVESRSDLQQAIERTAADAIEYKQRLVQIKATLSSQSYDERFQTAFLTERAAVDC